MSSSNSETRTNSSPLLVALAWAIVVIPTGWGLSYTIQNAMKLFTARAAAAASPTSAITAPTPVGAAAKP